MRLLIFVAIAISALHAVAAEEKKRPADLSRSSFVELSQQCDLTEGQPKVAVEALGAALIGAILPSVISSGVDYVAKALEAQAQPETKTLIARGAADIITIERNGEMKYAPSWSCITVIIADPEPGEELGGRGWRSEDNKERTRDRERVREQAREKGVEGLPYFYLEALVERSDDHRFFRLVPKLVYYKRPLVSSWGDGRRSIVTTFSFARPGQDSFASSQFSLEGLQADSYLIENKLRVKTDWVTALAPDEEEKSRAQERKALVTAVATATATLAAKQKSLEAARTRLTVPYAPPSDEYAKHVAAFCDAMKSLKKDHEQCPPEVYDLQHRASFHSTWLAEKKDEGALISAVNEAQAALTEAIKKKDDAQKDFASEKAGKVNIQVGVSETREGSKLLGFIAGVFRDSQKDVTSALQTELIKSRRQAAQKAAADQAIADENAKDDQRIAVLNAEKVVAEKEDALAALGANASAAQIRQAQDEVRVAKIQANQVYRKAGHAIPYPEASSF